ncbi:MAG: hypothetical protein WDZ77_01860 [Candidatus Pacearchaeota archaeon]
MQKEKIKYNILIALGLAGISFSFSSATLTGFAVSENPIVNLPTNALIFLVSLKILIFAIYGLRKKKVI